MKRLHTSLENIFIKTPCPAPPTHTHTQRNVKYVCL